jgi:hypothetical protein
MLMKKGLSSARSALQVQVPDQASGLPPINGICIHGTLPV